MKCVKRYIILLLVVMLSIFVTLVLDSVIKTLLQWFQLYIPDFVLTRDYLGLNMVVFWHFLISYFLFSKYARRFNYKLFEVLLFFLVPYILVPILNSLINKQEIDILNFAHITILGLSIFLGYLFARKTKIIKVFTIISIGFIIIMLNNYLFPLSLQKQNFYTISGTYSKTINLNDIKFLDESFQDVVLNKNDILVLDFWHNHCGVCVKKFPEFEQLEKKLKSNEQIKFLLVNVAENSSEREKSAEILKRHNINTKNVFLNKANINLFDITYYPTVLVIKNEKIVFRGQIETLNIFKSNYF